MQEEHELEMKAEELFNMTFGPLTWNPDDEDEAKDIVDCAVKDGLMAMPDAEDMEECLDDVARDAQDRMINDICGEHSVRREDRHQDVHLGDGRPRLWRGDSL